MVFACFPWDSLYHDFVIHTAWMLQTTTRKKKTKHALLHKQNIWSICIVMIESIRKAWL